MLFFVFQFSSFVKGLISVKWFKNNVEIVNANKLTFWCKEPGIYKAIIYDLCTVQSKTNEIDIQSNITSVKNLKNIGGLKIFPNPSNEFVYINFSDENLKNEIFDVEVYDVFGKLIIRNEGLLGQKNEINISNLSNGTYSIKILFSKKNITTTEKIIKIKN